MTHNAAKALNLLNLGDIEVGKIADFTVFKVVDQDVKLVDSMKHEVISHQQIIPTHTIVKNEIYTIGEEE